MAKLFYTNIDLKGNQLENGVIHNATTAPSDPKSGQVYYNTDDKLMYQYDGTQWVVVGGSVEELPTDVTKVVTGSSTSNGKATLQTTDLKDMKVGVGLQNLATVDANTTLEDEFQAIDTALQDVKTTYVKAAGNYTGSNNILVAGVDGNGIKTASASGYSIETTLDPTHSTNIPTSEAVATYIGSLAGGINYKGTIGSSDSDTVKTLPTDTTEVKVGDAYAVTTAGKYIATAITDSQVGDLIICNSISPISWTEVPINFTVEDKALTNFAPKDGLQTIATVDGKNITMSLQAITIGESEGEGGNVIIGIEADGNNKLTLTKGNALTTVSPTTAVKGVVTSVVQNGNTVDVTYTDLAYNDAPTGIQYVTSVSQASNGKVTVSGTNFDGTVSTSNPSTSNAPTTKAVKDYVDGKINALDGGATIATESNSVVTLKASVQEVDGVVSQGSGADIVLAKVAKTGKAEDVKTTAIMTTDGQTQIVPAGNVQDSLQYIARELNAAVSGSVTSFGGEYGVITVGNGLQMDGKTVLTKVNEDGYIVNTVGYDENGALDINSAKVDSNYTTANTTNLATVGTVKTAIEGLDVSNITGFGAGKTLETLTETDGKISASFQDIEITHNKVTDWGSNVGVTAVAESTENGKISVTTNGTTAQVSVRGLGTAAYKADTYFEEAFEDGKHNVVTISEITPSGTNIATRKVEFFDGAQSSGALITGAAAEALYISKAVSASNPIITHEDLSGITGAMVYKGAINANSDLPTSGVQAGWTYVVATKGTYDGQVCEVGDMIIAKDSTPTWNIINGENQVENKSAILTAGSEASDIAVVDGTTITAKVNVTAGSATIATVTNDGVVTITPTVSQAENTGTIKEASGTKITLAKVATTGNSTDVSYDSTSSGLQATNTQAAIDALNSKITSANITIDGHKGAIKTGNGLTDVTADGGSFGIKIDSANDNGLSVGANGLAMAKATGSTFGTVEVTAGNGLTLTNGVVAYAHNTSPITVASKSGNIITINGILKPDASDNIETSNPIALAAVAATGAATNLTVISAKYGGSEATTNAQTALDNLANNAVYVHNQALTFNNKTATITISGADLQNTAITEIRDGSHNVVECDVEYTDATTITITANGNPSGLYAIVHYKKAKAQA